LIAPLKLGTKNVVQLLVQRVVDFLCWVFALASIQRARPTSLPALMKESVGIRPDSNKVVGRKDERKVPTKAEKRAGHH